MNQITNFMNPVAKAETFDDLRQAVRDCGDAYERKMAQVRNK